MEPSFGVTLSSSSRSSAYTMRSQLRSWLCRAGIEATVSSDIASAVNEAFVNAVEHPISRLSERITVDGKINAQEVVIRVHDDGRWNYDLGFDRRHYGYSLMETLMDAVDVARSPSGTVVTLRRML